MEALLKLVPDILLFSHGAHPMGKDLERLFGFDNHCGVGLNLGPIPNFLTQTIGEEGAYRIWVDYLGVTRRAIKNHYHMPEYLAFPVETREDFARFKVRYDPHDMRRYPLIWGEELFVSLRKRDCPLAMGFDGFFGKPMEIIGLSKLLYAFHDNPLLIHDINEFWANFLIEFFGNVLQHVIPDWITIGEDVAYKTSMHISPQHFREFISPYLRRVVDFFHGHGIDTIFVDSDGHVDELIGLCLEAGVNGSAPLEVAAEVDAVALSKRYGPDLLLIGNIDKRALTGDREMIRHEVMPKLSYFRERGGFIPSIDHRVSSDIPLDNYLYYLELVKSFEG
jgi:uroporphyrinogen decarboxylase